MGRPANRLGPIVAAMTIGNALVLVSQTAVPLALPSIIADLDVSPASAQWVLTASILPLAGLMVFGGRLADLFGLRRIFVLGSFLFAGATLASGLAPDFTFLVVARIVQGIGGALILPTSVAIVAAAAGEAKAGRALGTVGGAAAVAGACGPIIGGLLTSAFDWRAVMLVNVPLALIAAFVALRVVAADSPRESRERIDFVGAALLGLSLAGLVFGVTQSQTWGWGSPGVMFPLAAAVAGGFAFVLVERRVENPLMDFGLLRRYSNFAGATISQAAGGFVEMGLGIIFPLILVLNLEMTPAQAGLALLPTTLPMVLVAPLAGRWYDRVGGRLPLATGFAFLIAAGLALYLGASGGTLISLVPGLLLYGIGLAIVLTVNDPVSLDQVPIASHGQASGVSGTAEQFGGAFGIAALYAIFHGTYLAELHHKIDASSLGNLTEHQAVKLRDSLLAAEQTGLDPSTFPPGLQEYLVLTYDASMWGYSMAFLVAGLVALLGLFAVTSLVRRAPNRADVPRDTDVP